MSSARIHTVGAALVAGLLVGSSLPAQAQTAPPPEQPAVIAVTEAPIPWLVLDLRAGFPALGKDQTTAADLGVADIDLPNRARSLVVGVHAYPLRRGRFKVGLGAELLTGSASSQKKDADGEPAGPVVHRQIHGVSTQVSLNFGRGLGWSYFTVGTGPFKFDSYLDEATPDGQGASTLNFGGGARWFNWTHVAFMVDLRFYLTKPGNPTAIVAGRDRKKIVLLSAGISIK